jgi:hypothetical protein
MLNLSWIISLSTHLYVIIMTLNFFIELVGVSRSGAGLEEGPNSTSTTHVVLLSVFHLSAIGALGIWLWAKIHSSGDQPECTPVTFLTIFSHDISVMHSSLHHSSISLYSMAVVPFLNLFIFILAGTLVPGILSFAYCGLRVVGWPENWHKFILICGILAMVLLEVLFIVDTELLIWRSSKWVKKGELQWTFGQTLALILVVVPLFEMMKAGFKSWKEGNHV